MKRKKLYLSLIGVVALLLIFFWAYFPALSHYRELRIQEDMIDQEIAQLDAKIQDLQAEKEQLTENPEYLEKIIRDELGLVKPGEIVYKFVKEGPDPTALSPLESLASTPMPDQAPAAAIRDNSPRKPLNS